MAAAEEYNFLSDEPLGQEEIEKRLCYGRSFNRVSELECNCSDSHEGGKIVVKCHLDNGHVLIYKPHGLKKELTYQRLYGWFCESSIYKCEDCSGCPYKSA